MTLPHAVGREWRWQMDDPESIVEGALGHHVRMINEFKGVPGVMPERLAEGMQVMRWRASCDAWKALLCSV